jgi:hypothetical protein
MDKIKVIYIAGIGRSGSTVLTKVLGSIKGGFPLNELSFVWENGFDKNRLCSCSKPFQECEFWTQVIHDMEVKGYKKPEYLRHIGNHVPQNRDLPFVIGSNKRVLSKKFSSLDKHTTALQELYSSIFQHSKSSFLIDSSKLPSYGFILSLLNNINVYYIHLIRDPRAVAFSWKKEVQRKDTQEDITMEQYSIWQSTIKWIWGNYVTSLLRKKNKYLFIRYEDFCESPEETLNKILKFCSIETDKNPIQGRTFFAGEEHSIWGNPMRMQTGEIEIKKDSAWINKLALKDKILTTFLSLPFLIRYGYSVKWFKKD